MSIKVAEAIGDIKGVVGHDDVRAVGATIFTGEPLTDDEVAQLEEMFDDPNITKETGNPFPGRGRIGL